MKASYQYMLKFLTELLQLILSPREGWEDLAKDNPDPERLLRTSYYPLLVVAAATAFLELVYDATASLSAVIIRSVAIFGAYFVAVYLAKLIFDVYLARLTTGETDMCRAFTLIIASLGMMVLFRIVANCLPWHLIVLDFLPLYVVLVLSKAYAYLGVAKREEIRFLGIASGALVAVPLGIYYLIYFVTR